MTCCLAKSFPGDLSLDPWCRHSIGASVYTAGYSSEDQHWGGDDVLKRASELSSQVEDKEPCAVLETVGQVHASIHIPFQSSFPRPMKRRESASSC